MSVKHAFNVTIGFFGAVVLKALRLTDPDWLSDFCGAVMRRIGPWFKEHRVGRENLTAAFPEKSPAEIERILAGVWEHVGRFGAEFAHLDRLWDQDPARPNEGRIRASLDTYHRGLKIRDERQPTLLFSAHIGNWELGAVAAHQLGFDSAVLYRPPNLGAIADTAIKMRASLMGQLIPTGFDAPIKIAQALERGMQVGMLVDQHFTTGVDVTFFGRPAKANPLIARLARHFDCPIYGLYVLRQPDHRYAFEMVGPIAPARDPDGKIDVQGTMQVITSEIESWIRKCPEQWLWLHRRWR